MKKFFEDVPKEIIMEIHGFLNGKETVRNMRTSKTWKEILQNDYTWKCKLKSELGVDYDLYQDKSTTPYKEYISVKKLKKDFDINFDYKRNRNYISPESLHRFCVTKGQDKLYKNDKNLRRNTWLYLIKEYYTQGYIHATTKWYSKHDLNYAELILLMNILFNAPENSVAETLNEIGQLINTFDLKFRSKDILIILIENLANRRRPENEPEIVDSLVHMFSNKYGHEKMYRKEPKKDQRRPSVKAYKYHYAKSCIRYALKSFSIEICKLIFEHNNLELEKIFRHRDQFFRRSRAFPIWRNDYSIERRIAFAKYLLPIINNAFPNEEVDNPIVDFNKDTLEFFIKYCDVKLTKKDIEYLRTNDIEKLRYISPALEENNNQPLANKL